MVEFSSWIEILVVLGIFSIIVVVPCIFSVLIGRNMIDQLGHYPSKAPLIQMSVFLKIVILEVTTASAFFFFYKTFVS